MLLVALFTLLALAEDDRTECEKEFHTPRWQSGVRAYVKNDCKREKDFLGKAYKGRFCRLAYARIILPDPFDPDQVQIEVAEAKEYERVGQDGQTERQKLTYNNAWIEPGATFHLRGGDGKPIPLQVVERTQGREYFGPEGLVWTVKVRMTRDQLQHLRKVGLDGWSFEVNGMRFTHFVKKAKWLPRVIDCVLEAEE